VVCQNYWLSAETNQVSNKAPYWKTPSYSFSPLTGYIKKVTFVLRLTRTTSFLLWYAKTICSQPTGLLEPQAPVV
jgi:hypothetical protein